MKKITKKELNNRLGYIMLSVFAFFLIDPLQVFIEKTISLNPLIVGIGGVLFTLWLFDF